MLYSVFVIYPQKIWWDKLFTWSVPQDEVVVNLIFWLARLSIKRDTFFFKYKFGFASTNSIYQSWRRDLPVSTEGS